MRILPAFRRAARLLTQKDVQDVENVLDQWQRDGVGRTVAVNLRDREHFLPRRHMADLLRALARARGAPLEQVAEQYKQECYRHQLCGGRVRLSRYPEHLGRAVNREVFINYLNTRYPQHFPKPRHAEDFVNRLLSGAELDPHEEELEMTEFTAWATWREDDPAADPFSFVKHNLAAEVQAALGLDPRMVGMLLLLRYHRPADVALHRPTVADAGLFPYFDPPMSSEKAHSRTRPWPHFRIREAPPEYDSADSHPEAVHRPVQLRNLSQPVDALP